ncbi:MAG: APC family permease [Janthinobacterium lividum]
MRAISKDDPRSTVRHILFGHPLKTSSQDKETLGFFLGLPVLALDALSSVAYASEEIMIALSVAGTSLYGLSIPIALMIVLLLASLIISYIQTIQAYPDGGGAYTIARNHLGSLASLVASSSLLIDYTLTVSVSVTAGIRALASSYPWILMHQVRLSVLGVLLLTWINLRGLKESAKLVSPFVYSFIAFMIGLCLTGLFSGFDHPLNHTQEVQHITKSNSYFYLLDLAIIPIVLRAFAGGCTAMTGVEAIANAGSMLSKPHAIVAQRILVALGLLLGFMFLSVTIIAYNLGLTPLNNESLLSQITRKILGVGFLHDSFQILTTLILFLAANTAFAGAPKLSAMLARDGWLPKQLYTVGDRLVFSKGVIALGLTAAALIVVFNADTHQLIPLYAIGVFSAFTLSQAGMVIYWRTSGKDTPYRYIKPSIKGFINGFGAVLTGIALMTTFEAKFKEGAFLILIAIPIMISICLWIRHHYCRTMIQLEITSDFNQTHHQSFCQTTTHTIIVPTSNFNRASL